ncbi:MAG: SDR family oxidoreductase [Bacteroidota bacterium]
MASLQDKVIWLTGASSGIGESLAYQLAKKGAKLILSSRRKEELERVKGACNPTNQANIQILPIDLGKAETLALTTEAAINLFGKVDILINNGGISQRSLAKDTELKVDRAVMEVNFFGAIALTKYLLPDMIKRKSGHFVNISSLVGKFGTPYRSGYAASKHALHGFYDSLRAELWRENIKVTMVCPGFIKTNVSINALTEKGEKLNKMDKAQENGMDPDLCARKIIKAIEKEKEEVNVGGKERHYVKVKRFFPGIFSRMLRKAEVR